MCPSAPVENATVLLGLITAAGRVAYLTPAVPSDVLLQTDDNGGGPLEKRYRFAGPCVEAKCGFWTGTQCGLGARLADSYSEMPGANESVRLPRCAIRSRCRWYAEQGARACTACPLVITDNRT
jgi:hypothetical protein